VGRRRRPLTRAPPGTILLDGPAPGAIIAAPTRQRMPGRPSWWASRRPALANWRSQQPAYDAGRRHSRAPALPCHTRRPHPLLRPSRHTTCRVNGRSTQEVQTITLGRDGCLTGSCWNGRANDPEHPAGTNPGGGTAGTKLRQQWRAASLPRLPEGAASVAGGRAATCTTHLTQVGPTVSSACIGTV
jgi:hypothetical protein